MRQFFTRRNIAVLPIGASGIFVLFPQLDVIVSQIFFQSGVFIFSKMSFWTAVRDYHRASQTCVLVTMMLFLLVYAFGRHPNPLIAPHKVVYFTLTFLLGAGMVHGLKVLIGRARPHLVEEFGGSFEFTPAWQVAASCISSCSFPSGEAATAAAMLLLVIFLPERWRIPGAFVLLPILMLVSLNRVFMGAHFLSDVVISWALIFYLMNWLEPRISRNAHNIDAWVSHRTRWMRHGTKQCGKR